METTREGNCHTAEAEQGDTIELTDFQKHMLNQANQALSEAAGDMGVGSVTWEGVTRQVSDGAWRTRINFTATGEAA
jgi:hypothetical protein